MWFLPVLIWGWVGLSWFMCGLIGTLLRVSDHGLDLSLALAGPVALMLAGVGAMWAAVRMTPA